jgi:hypothetical protein
MAMISEQVTQPYLNLSAQPCHPIRRKTVLRGVAGKAKDFSLDEKNGPLFRDPFFNAWSGKRDSHLVSDPLKSKGFLFLPKQEKT